MLEQCPSMILVPSQYNSGYSYHNDEQLTSYSTNNQLAHLDYYAPHSSPPQHQHHSQNSHRSSITIVQAQNINQTQTQNQNLNMNLAQNQHHHQHQAYEHQTNHHSNQTTADYSIYNYDIDDEFSDILSVPASPAPSDDDSLYHVSSVSAASTPVTVKYELQDQNHTTTTQHHYYTTQHQHAIQQHHDYQHHNHSQSIQQTYDSTNCNQQQQVQHFHIDSQQVLDGHQQKQYYAASMTSSSYLSGADMSPPPSSLSSMSSSMSTTSSQFDTLSPGFCGSSIGQQQQTSTIALASTQQVPVQQQQTIQASLNSQAASKQQSPQSQIKHHPHSHRSSPIHLWEFLKELLQQVDSGTLDDCVKAQFASNSSLTSGQQIKNEQQASAEQQPSTIIRWLDKQRGVFKIEDSVRVAKLWGKRKNKPKMNYDKLSRSIRQYYKKGIMKKTDRSQRLVYQFCPAYCH